MCIHAHVATYMCVDVYISSAKGKCWQVLKILRTTVFEALSATGGLRCEAWCQPVRVANVQRTMAKKTTRTYSSFGKTTFEFPPSTTHPTKRPYSPLSKGGGNSFKNQQEHENGPLWDQMGFTSRIHSEFAWRFTGGPRQTRHPEFSKTVGWSL